VPKSIRRTDIAAGVVFVALLIVGVVALAVTPKATAKTMPAPGGTPTPSVAATHTSSPPAKATTMPPRAPAPVRTPKAPPPTPAAPPPTQLAAPPTQAPPPPPVTQAPAGCSPKTNAGNCYEPGEFCRDDDHGATGVAGDGEKIECEDNDGWRWEPV
jgi:hypothetical protein